MSQIIGNKVSSIKKLKNDTSSYFYFEAIRFNSSRDLAVNSDFLAKPLGERAFETSYVRWGFTLGMTFLSQKSYFLRVLCLICEMVSNILGNLLKMIVLFRIKLAIPIFQCPYN